MTVNAIHYTIVRLSLLSVALTGCSSLAPVYKRPPLPVAEKWANSAMPSSQRDTPNLNTGDRWEGLFTNVELRSLIELALKNNRDLRVANLNVQKSRALYRIERAGLMPQTQVGAAKNYVRTPGSLTSSGADETAKSYDLSVGITSWELDLFGKIRSLENQALNEYLATESARRATKINIIAETALAYLRLTANHELLAVATDTLKSRKQGLALQTQLRHVGSSSDLELNQASAEFNQAEDEYLASEAAFVQSRNALELLVGSSISGLELTLDPGESAVGVTDIPPGLPSDLLTHRPDIVAAEYQLVGAEANIGAARAAFFPSVTLTGSLGYASPSLNTLTSGANRTWEFLPKINVPIFTGGRLRAGLEVSKANRDIAVANYERTIQTAFQEVADALAVRATINKRVDAQQRRLNAAEAAHTLVVQLYGTGVASYLEVLDAQRTLNNALNDRITTKLAREQNLIMLYKSLGGAWGA
ncbi:efflux transporter outer membrane subunit [Pseudomonas palmensis]|uniref:efflux transporter outer membrane subunit n=1 Tax=Pseudomonas palmensis TaxID=2815362 RepID=UPI001AE12845|nr:efflux transporter outer membrane subunit [Pseudomonas palmensis]